MFIFWTKKLKMTEGRTDRQRDGQNRSSIALAIIAVCIADVLWKCKWFCLPRRKVPLTP